MKKHNGMRPQDIVVLLKIISSSGRLWHAKDLAYELYLSQSEISDSLNRSLIGGLVNRDKKIVHRQSIFDFLRYGLRFVFPAEPGALTNGLVTAHSHPLIRDQISSNQLYVWPAVGGDSFGSAIQPLYDGVVNAVKIDLRLYELLALTEVLRVGRTREIQLATELLNQRILHVQPNQH